MFLRIAVEMEADLWEWVVERSAVLGLTERQYLSASLVGSIKARRESSAVLSADLRAISETGDYPREGA